MKSKRLVTVLVIFTSMFLLTSGTAIAFNGGSAKRPSDLNPLEDDIEKDDDEMSGMEELIGHEEALDTAFENYNGTLLSFELDRDDQERTYVIEIVDDETAYTIQIDATSGELIESEEDDLEDDLDPDWEQLIGHVEALETAYQRVDGELISFDLEEDESNYIYDLQIKDKRMGYEIDIDSYSGEVLGSEVDDPRDNRRERGVGGSWNGTQGNFTSFDLLENGISNYTLHTNNTNLLLFERVIIQDMIIEETETQGAKYEIEGDETGIRIYDVAPALMKIDTESEEEEGPGRVSFDLGDLEVDGEAGNNLNLSYGNRTAKLLSVSHDDGDDSLDISVSDGVVNYTFEEELFLVFRMTDTEAQDREQDKDTEREEERERERDMEQNISEGISKGEIGGEVIVDRDREGFSETSVSYADMQMMTHAREENRIQVMVSSDTLGDEGKVVAIRVYKEAIDVDNLDELEITFDGDEIDMADDYQDLISSSDQAEYLMSMGSESMEVLVMVPHFSTHTIEIASVEASIGSLIDVQYFLPVAILTALVVLATVWIVKKEN